MNYNTNEFWDIHQLEKYTLKVIAKLAEQTTCIASIDGIVKSDKISNEEKVRMIGKICKIAEEARKRQL